MKEKEYENIIYHKYGMEIGSRTSSNDVLPNRTK